MPQCPCGSGIELDKCCRPVVAGTKPALTAEALMRSRYTAFVLGNLDHIENTYAWEKREGLDRPGVRDSFGSVEWVGLEIFSTTGGGENDDIGTVDFAARFKQDGKVTVHRENSNFRRDNDRWFYVDGETGITSGLGDPGKIGRNHPCPCGSGKKYKKCCGA